MYSDPYGPYESFPDHFEFVQTPLSNLRTLICCKDSIMTCKDDPIVCKETLFVIILLFNILGPSWDKYGIFTHVIDNYEKNLLDIFIYLLYMFKNSVLTRLVQYEFILSIFIFYLFWTAPKSS